MTRAQSSSPPPPFSPRSPRCACRESRPSAKRARIEIDPGRPRGRSPKLRQVHGTGRNITAGVGQVSRIRASRPGVLRRGRRPRRGRKASRVWAPDRGAASFRSEEDCALPGQKAQRSSSRRPRRVPPGSCRASLPPSTANRTTRSRSSAGRGANVRGIAPAGSEGSAGAGPRSLAGEARTSGGALRQI